jgi:hypothetical protein
MVLGAEQIGVPRPPVLELLCQKLRGALPLPLIPAIVMVVAKTATWSGHSTPSLASPAYLQGRHDTRRSRRRARRSIIRKQLVVLVALAMVAVMAVGVLDVSDADASKKKRRPPPPVNYPPSYNFVLCAPNSTCKGSPSADLMVGTPFNEVLKGAAGNDIYWGAGGANDRYTDESTSSDLYGGFENGHFTEEIIDDRGGLDRVDLSVGASSYASTDFVFTKLDYDGDGAENDLEMSENKYGADDDIVAYNHFGIGTIEYIKFSDTTLSGANIPGLTTP